MVTLYPVLMIICVAAALFMLQGCTDLTEFEHTLQAGIHIMNTPDLSVVHTIENISGARSLCSLTDCFIVATIEGKLIRFDLESYQQTGCAAIGNPSPSGYFEIEYSPTESSVYIIGALGQILEIQVPDMEILDNFSVCEIPVDIEIATEKPYFYVAGSSSCRIYEVRKESNGLSRTCTLLSSPTCMAIDHSQDTILVGTQGETELVSTGITVMRARKMDKFPTILAIETIPVYISIRLCAVFEYQTGMIATIKSYFAPPQYTGTVTIDGDIHYMCADSNGTHAYVLSYLGDNISRVVAYNCSNYFIESQIDLKGYPLDLEISPGGTLLVLTAE
ncbi:MAG: hypothetical protein K8S24_04640 [Candidatus Aegiribacteria sp.]|nr:hypothetical protein [Candidatus Aegiribacteria sp.]